MLHQYDNQSRGQNFRLRASGSVDGGNGSPSGLQSPRVVDAPLGTEASAGEAADQNDRDDPCDTPNDFLNSLSAEYGPDILSALAGKKDDDAVLLTAYMGSKYYLLSWLWKHTPADSKSVLDAFSGGANVSYFYKRKGLKVISNDKLAYPHHIARAFIENNTVTLTDEDIEAVLAPNPDAGTFCVDQFRGYYFNRPILRLLDRVWANIQKLEGYKKDLALAALGWTVVAKTKYGSFRRSNKTVSKGRPEAGKNGAAELKPDVFEASLRRHLARANSLVFDNSQENKALQMDAVDAVQRHAGEVDFVYADPPYITAFSKGDYGKELHFVEGLMTMWHGKELRDNDRRDFESPVKYTRAGITELIQKVIAAAPKLLLSFRDLAFPDGATVSRLMQGRYESNNTKSVRVEYRMARNDPAGGKYTKELLFIGEQPRQLSAAASANKVMTVQCVDAAPLGLVAAAEDDEEDGDKKFKFILTHVGANRNGDFFDADELRRATASAVGKKVDLAHYQGIRDIVGCIASAEYIEAGANSRVECEGELFTEDSEAARLTHKLMKKGVVAHVSMECEFAEGECSVCGRKFSNYDGWCEHLRRWKGSEFEGKKVYQILRRIVFTGVGLLDREGADQGAKIQEVAKQKEQETEEDMKTRASGNADETSKLDPAEKDKLIKQLQSELETLQKKLDAAEEKLKKAEEEKAAAARKAKAEKLVDTMEKAGQVFETPEAKASEVNRLSKLSDEAFAATESTTEAFAKAAKKKKDEEPDPEEEEDPEDVPEDPKKKKKGKAKASMETTAGIKDPVPQPDTRKLSLEDRLKKGFMAIHEARNQD